MTTSSMEAIAGALARIEAKLDTLVSAPSAPSAPPSPDKRSKEWEYVLRYWSGDELIGETDPVVRVGTGGLFDVAADLAAELHGTAVPDLSPEKMEAGKYLSRLRNNLGRYGHASVRIPYSYDGGSFICQLDVKRAS